MELDGDFALDKLEQAKNYAWNNDHQTWLLIIQLIQRALLPHQPIIASALGDFIARAPKPCRKVKNDFVLSPELWGLKSPRVLIDSKE
jgi:hypothetical protein